MNKVFVGNLSFNTTEQALSEAFAAFGTVNEVIILVDRVTNCQRGFGFVTMETSVEAQKAIAGLDGKEISPSLGKSAQHNAAINVQGLSQEFR